MQASERGLHVGRVVPSYAIDSGLQPEHNQEGAWRGRALLQKSLESCRTGGSHAEGVQGPPGT